jgi:hypothetical protein
VALMQNGTRKGGAVAAYEILERSPGLEDIWQLHWSYNAGIEHNPAGVFLANVDEPATIAGVLTAPAPAGRGGPGGPGGPAGAPAAGAPAPGAGAATAPTPAATPPSPAPVPGTAPAPGQPSGPPQAAQPPAGAGAPGGPGAGRGGFGGGGRGAAAAAQKPALYIKLSAQSDGSFTVTNTRNGYTKTYARRASAGTR